VSFPSTGGLFAAQVPCEGPAAVAGAAVDSPDAIGELREATIGPTAGVGDVAPVLGPPFALTPRTAKRWGWRGDGRGRRERASRPCGPWGRARSRPWSAVWRRSP
jgi:hypothetical protein